MKPWPHPSDVYALILDAAEDLLQPPVCVPERNDAEQETWQRELDRMSKKP